MPHDSDFYFDAALIAKFYLNEPGGEAVRNLVRAATRVFSSAIAIAEVSAAFHRHFREGAIDAAMFKALQGQFAHDLKSELWTLVPITDHLLERVQALFMRLPPTTYLRSLDALHLVTAASENFDRIYSNDRHLLAACSKAGLRGVNPL